MQRIAKFEKISKEQWEEDTINASYNNIKIPQRATKGSAGYDFCLPFDIRLIPGESIKIPTGIRVHINTNWVLKIYPRSSLGFKYRMQIDNSTGIIDSDYYYSSNEGHIWVKISNRGDKTLILKEGDAFVQGIFSEYGITDDDNVEDIRDGGIGSTNK